MILTFFQEDTGNSQPVEEEVIIISSDSELRPRQKIRRVTRKVRFSHPLAYQDPDFLLKQQQFENRRQTQTTKDAELSSGLPDTTRKRRTEVISNLYPFFTFGGSNPSTSQFLWLQLPGYLSFIRRVHAIKHAGF